MQKEEVYTIDQAYQKLARYCVYQERCHKEVMQKLQHYKLTYQEKQEVITKLIRDNFLNEERFTLAFTRDKFNLQQWGRERIKRALKQRQISDYLLNKALKEIDEESYTQTLDLLIEKKLKLLRKETPLQKRKKLIGFLARKGYEYELIYDTIRHIRF